MLLHRYISLEKFECMLKSSSLYFVDPLTAWSDDKEGYLYRAMTTTSGQEKIVQIMKEYGFLDKDIDQWTNFLKGQPFGLRCQCWCKNSNSSKMWDAYCPDKRGLRITTSSTKLSSLNYMDHSVDLMPIAYKMLSLEEEIKETFNGKVRAFYFPRAFKTKRTEYEFEEEIRAYTLSGGQKGNIEVPVPNMSDFICEVVAHPEASEEYTLSILNLCAKYHIYFHKNERNI